MPGLLVTVAGLVLVAGIFRATTAESGALSMIDGPRLAAGHDAARDGDGDDLEAEDGQSGSLLNRLGLSVETDLELALDSQGSEHSAEVTFDEVGLAVEGAWWQAEIGFKYEMDGSRGFVVEEGALQIGGTDRWPWFARAGRTVLPFGEFDSRFVEDPLVTAVGETDEDTIILGYESAHLELPVGVFRGAIAGDGDLDLVISARVRTRERTGFGVSWCSDLGEASEFVELHRERVAAHAGDAEPLLQRVDGLALHASWKLETATVCITHVRALGTFAPGFVDVRPLRPSAWNLEITVPSGTRWLLASRIETSADLPGGPEWQLGAAASYALTPFATLIVDCLHGEFDGAAPARDLIGMQLAFEHGF